MKLHPIALFAAPFLFAACSGVAEPDTGVRGASDPGDTIGAMTPSAPEGAARAPNQGSTDLEAPVDDTRLGPTFGPEGAPEGEELGIIDDIIESCVWWYANPLWLQATAALKLVALEGTVTKSACLKAAKGIRTGAAGVSIAYPIVAVLGDFGAKCACNAIDWPGKGGGGGGGVPPRNGQGCFNQDRCCGSVVNGKCDEICVSRTQQCP